MVVANPVGLAIIRGHLHGPLAVLDRAHATGDNRGALEFAAVRRDHVARLDRSGGSLRKEGLIGHVRARIDHNDGCLAAPQLLAQPNRGVQADVSPTQDEDARCLSAARGPLRRSC